MNKALLDTDILSEILKAKNAAVVSKAVAYQENFEQFTISVITVMEVVKGLHKVRRTDALKKFLRECLKTTTINAKARSRKGFFGKTRKEKAKSTCQSRFDGLLSKS